MEIGRELMWFVDVVFGPYYNICYYRKFLFILVEEDNDLGKRCFTYRFSLVVPRKKYDRFGQWKLGFLIHRNKLRLLFDM